MSKALTHGSLFAGMGGLDLAIADVFNARTVWVSEIDKGACKVLAHRYPGVPNLGDITTIDWATVEPVDIIAGGSPCQDLSTAGRRAGMTDGTRSNLWVAMREAIAALKPNFVVWENVYGALSATADSAVEHCPGCMGNPADGGPVLRALGRVLGDLADLGFDAEVRGLRAADVGACHGRFRVFLLAYARGLGGHEALEHDGRRAAAGDRASVPDQRDREPLRPGPDGGLTLLPTPQAHDHTNGKTREQVEAARRRSKAGVRNLNEVVIHEIPLPPTPTLPHPAADSRDPAARMASRHQTELSDGVRPLPIPSANLGNNGGPQHPDKRRAGGHSVSIEDAVHGLAIRKLLPTPSVADTQGGRKHRSGERSDELLLNGIAHHEQFGQYAAAIARHEQALGRPAPPPTEPGPKGNPRLSAAFTEWMMMLPAGWITDVPGITRNEALKLAGNGVVPPQAAAALRDMKRHITPTQETTA